jgi:hypothetical protein
MKENGNSKHSLRPSTTTLKHKKLVQKDMIMDLLSSTDDENSRLHNTTLKVLSLGNYKHFFHWLYNSWKHHWKLFSRKVFRAAVIRSFTLSTQLKYCPLNSDFMTLKR